MAVPQHVEVTVLGYTNAWKREWARTVGRLRSLPARAIALAVSAGDAFVDCDTPGGALRLWGDLSDSPAPEADHKAGLDAVDNYDWSSVSFTFDAVSNPQLRTRLFQDGKYFKTSVSDIPVS